MYKYLEKDIDSNQKQHILDILKNHKWKVITNDVLSEIDEIFTNNSKIDPEKHPSIEEIKVEIVKILNDWINYIRIWESQYYISTMKIKDNKWILAIRDQCWIWYLIAPTCSLVKRPMPDNRNGLIPEDSIIGQYIKNINFWWLKTKFEKLFWKLWDNSELGLLYENKNTLFNIEIWDYWSCVINKKANSRLAMWHTRSMKDNFTVRDHYFEEKNILLVSKLN